MSPVIALICALALEVALEVASASQEERAPLVYTITGAPNEAVEVGQAFELVVTRAWRDGLEPEPWNERRLAPLRVVEMDVRVEREEGFAIETRRLRAYAFDVGPLALDDAVLVARDLQDGSVHEARSEPVALLVRSALSADDDGAIEVPLVARGPAQRSAWWTVVAALAVLFASIAGLVRARARRGARCLVSDAEAEQLARRAAQRATAIAVLLERLDHLGQRTERDLDTAGAARWNRDLWTALRDALGLAYGVSFGESTVDEVADQLARLEAPDAVRGLVAVGRDTDLVRFALAFDGAQEREERIVRARTAVQLLDFGEGEHRVHAVVGERGGVA